MGDVGGCFLGAQNLYCHPPKKNSTYCWIALPSKLAKSKSFYPGWDSTTVERQNAALYSPPFSTFEEKHDYCNRVLADDASDQIRNDRATWCWYPDKHDNECRPTIPLAATNTGQPCKECRRHLTEEAIRLAGEPKVCEQPHNCFNYEFSARLTILMACSITMFHFVYRWILLEGPGARFRKVSA